MSLFVWLIGAYLVGSIPASLLVARIAKGIDIRQHGSGNPGATNVYRVCGPVPGIIAFAADFLKGFLPVLLALRYLGNGNPLSALAVGLACILGHVFTVFLRFKGGKGVATGAGVFFALLPLPALFAFILFWVIFFLTGYISLSSIAAAVFLPAYCWISRVPTAVSIVVTAVAAIIIYRHRTNIRNLIEGKEYKFSRKRTS